MSKPACSKPRERPPAPANKSIPIGRTPLGHVLVREKFTNSPFDGFWPFQLTLPYHETIPSERAQIPQVLAISLAVRREFFHPIRDTSFGNCRVTTARVTVPKAAVHED